MVQFLATGITESNSFSYEPSILETSFSGNINFNDQENYCIAIKSTHKNPNHYFTVQIK